MASKTRFGSSKADCHTINRQDRVGRSRRISRGVSPSIDEKLGGHINQIALSGHPAQDKVTNVDPRGKRQLAEKSL